MNERETWKQRLFLFPHSCAAQYEWVIITLTPSLISVWSIPSGLLQLYECVCMFVSSRAKWEPRKDPQSPLTSHVFHRDDAAPGRAAGPARWPTARRPSGDSSRERSRPAPPPSLSGKQTDGALSSLTTNKHDVYSTVESTGAWCARALVIAKRALPSWLLYEACKRSPRHMLHSSLRFLTYGNLTQRWGN